jgi:HSP20 family protein
MIMSLVQWKPKCSDPVEDFFGMDVPNFGLTLFPEFKQRGRYGSWLPPLDVSEEKNSVHVKADLPGLKKEDITLSCEGSVLTIRGERKSEEQKQEKKYYRVERSYGVFERSIDIGVPIDQSKVKAKYNDGVLEVEVPKTEYKAASSITIE